MEDRTLAHKVVASVGGETTRIPTRTFWFWFCSKQYLAATDRTDRPSNILFYDKHVIDLCHRICALYRMGEDIETREKPNNHLAVSTPMKKRRTRRALFYRRI